ncbi:hypothetical protein FZEAL_10188 [Fusarium zealandicum]|uniref:Transcription elongation factor S-II n=1 Tax=Fusarium zealandicum TaxID=1053134 RepID=A0A8H4XCT4_9HYPO|nr:hypothetical protein FZEAL_10188 [Fusarium zealandicum]
MPSMDERELAARVKALTKCVAANEPAENAIKLLETLKKDASPTEEMLRSTRAGVFVGKLRSNSNKEIARAAAELVTKWKKLVEQEKKTQKSKMGSGSPAPAPASSPAPPPSSSSGGAKRAFKGDPEKRKHDTDGVDIKRTDSNVRNQCIGLVYNGLAYRSTAPESDVIAKAVAVESAAHSKFKGETPEYKKKIRSLFTNLKNKSNKELGRSVMSGDILPDRFVTMSDDELKSEDQRKKEVELEKENMLKAQVPQEQKSISEDLRCGRCKQKKVSYTQAQTRAADEPMTTFCECMACGHRWKVCARTLQDLVREDEADNVHDSSRDELVVKTALLFAQTAFHIGLRATTLEGHGVNGERERRLEHVPNNERLRARDTFLSCFSYQHVSFFNEIRKTGAGMLAEEW